MNKADFQSTPAAEALSTYQSIHRHPNRPPFEIGDVVHLFPDPEFGGTNDGQSPWCRPWPHGNKAGVYLIYSIDLELLYVGKASMGQTLGKRLYCHFGGGDSCVFDPKGWSIEPRFVVNIAMPEDSAFEAPALEEFLVSTLLPRLNVYGL